MAEFWINPPTGLENLPTGSCETRREKRFWSKPAGMVHKPIDRFFQQVQPVGTCTNLLEQVQRVLETCPTGSGNLSIGSCGEQFFFNLQISITQLGVKIRLIGEIGFPIRLEMHPIRFLGRQFEEGRTVVQPTLARRMPDTL